MRLPDFAAEAGTRRFNADLYREHLEEASFLYEQRRLLHDDPGVTWLAIGEFEQRLDAHLEALASGDATALEVCRQQAGEGDPGALYVAMCRFCRQGRRDLAGVLLKDLDPESPLRARAVSDAMQDEMPTEWAEALLNGLSRGFGKLVPMLLRYAGYRRLSLPGLDKFADRVHGESLAPFLWERGRVARDRLPATILDFVDDAEPAVRTNATIALLRGGDPRALAKCRNRSARGDATMHIPLGISGGRSDAAAMLKVAMPTAETLIALGVLGDLGAVRLLVDMLGDDLLGSAAATSLQLITGADLREEVFVPEPVEEDEMFEDEREV